MNTTAILRRSPRGAFTLVELLVVIGIIGLLAGIMVPSMWRARSLAQRATCANNIRDIVRGCINYTQDGAWNRPGGAAFVAQALPNVGVTTANWSNLQTGNTGCMWLLLTGREPSYSNTPYIVKQSWAGFSTFHCPEAGRRGKRAPVVDDGKFKIETVSYGFLSQVPFKVSQHAENGVTIPEKNYPAVSIHDLGPRMIVVADSSPWLTPGSDTWSLDPASTGNSLNHRNEGQNVGTLGGDVTWMTTSKIQLGTESDDIYLPDVLKIPNADGGPTQSGSQTEGRRSLPTDNLILY